MSRKHATLIQHPHSGETRYRYIAAEGVCKAAGWNRCLVLGRRLGIPQRYWRAAHSAYSRDTPPVFAWYTTNSSVVNDTSLRWEWCEEEMPHATCEYFDPCPTLP